MALAAAAGLANLGMMAGKWARNNPQVQKFVKDKSANLLRAIPLPSKEPYRSIAQSAKNVGLDAIKSGVDPAVIGKEVSGLIKNPKVRKAALDAVPVKKGSKLAGLKKLAQKQLK